MNRSANDVKFGIDLFIDSRATHILNILVLLLSFFSYVLNFFIVKNVLIDYFDFV